MKQIDHLYSRSIFNYPSLYYSDDISLSKFSILDHNLNTIGSGVRTFSQTFKRAKIHYSELIENYQIIENPYWLQKDPFVNITYEQFTKKEHQTKWVKKSELDSYLSEMLNWHEIYEPCHAWNIYEESEYKTRIKNPYPNFSKNYSIIYNADDIHICSIDTLKEFIWFYKECISFFNSENVVHYSSHPGYNNNRNQFIEYLNKMPVDKINENYNYEQNIRVEFSGDCNKFIDDVWEREKNTIISFCMETITHLENLIASRRNRLSRSLSNG